MKSKWLHSLQKKQEKTFCSRPGINAEELREGDRVSEEEEGRKGKAVAVI
jgi:hypothetical protein